MTKKIILFYITILPLVFLFVFSFLSSALFAQAVNLIEELPGQPTLSRGEDLLPTYLSWVFRLSLGAAAILAVLFIIIGGVRYTLTSISPSEKSAAKQMIWNAIYGLLIVLVAFLVLRTINPDLVNFSLRLPSITGGIPAGPGPGGPGPGGPGPGPITYPDDWLVAENALRADFGALGITVNRDPCPTPLSTASGCTNVYGLGSSAVSGVKALRSACGCPIMITGGTERDSHTTHGIGRSIVDIRKNSGVNLYVTANTVSSQSTSYGTLHTLANGDRYLDEGDHWHIVF